MCDMRKNIVRISLGGAGVILLALLWTGEISTTEDKQTKNTEMALKRMGEEIRKPLSFLSDYEKFRYSLLKETPITIEDVFSPATIALLSQEKTNEVAVTPEVVEPEIIQPEPTVEPVVVQPEPEPKSSVVVAATEPTPEPAPSEAPVEIPVENSVDAPGDVVVDSITVPPTQPPTTITNADQMASIMGGCTIMGSTYTYLEQMIRYYNANEEYPSYYAGTDAPTIEVFCQIYLEEAEAEGVRAEVAFCQAMKETGYLRFLGDVRIEQNNFAGIGTTGGGVPGYSFESVRQGIRAQIQHLKAYASTEELKNTCVDPRFDLVKRGTSLYVEWLGIHENPFGGGWAADLNYGHSIINDYIVKLFSN